eukprot:TRINITY_DN17875_c2_g1_i1.p1 TRINITY_DN17875_c2_g1~~TRINITY_DN17875_c2_g1_i1.p1  ORF type:complete len:497 (+),score=68.11 TRINITY_DN17875_c2_g1_i1:57-1547(+)
MSKAALHRRLTKELLADADAGHKPTHPKGTLVSDLYSMLLKDCGVAPPDGGTQHTHRERYCSTHMRWCRPPGGVCQPLSSQFSVHVRSRDRRVERWTRPATAQHASQPSASPLPTPAHLSPPQLQQSPTPRRCSAAAPVLQSSQAQSTATGSLPSAAAAAAGFRTQSPSGCAAAPHAAEHSSAHGSVPTYPSPAAATARTGASAHGADEVVPARHSFCASSADASPHRNADRRRAAAVPPSDAPLPRHVGPQHPPVQEGTDMHPTEQFLFGAAIAAVAAARTAPALQDPGAPPLPPHTEPTPPPLRSVVVNQTKGQPPTQVEVATGGTDDVESESDDTAELLLALTGNGELVDVLFQRSPSMLNSRKDGRLSKLSRRLLDHYFSELSPDQRTAALETLAAKAVTEHIRGCRTTPGRQPAPTPPSLAASDDAADSPLRNRWREGEKYASAAARLLMAGRGAADGERAAQKLRPPPPRAAGPVHGVPELSPGRELRRR